MNLQLFLAEMIPFEAHLKNIKNAIDDYLLIPSEEKKEEIEGFVIFLTMHLAAAKKGGADKLSSELNEIEKSHKFFKTNSN